MPGQIAFLHIGAALSSTEGIVRSELLQRQVKALWRKAVSDGIGADDLREVALVAVGCVWKADSDAGIQEILGECLKAPANWEAPLACAWPHLKFRPELLSGLASQGTPEVISTLSSILLANMQPVGAAEQILSAFPTLSGDLILILKDLGEADLADALVQAVPFLPEPSSPEAADSTAVLLQKATFAAANGNWQSAHTAIDEAWESANQTRARVADHLARIARIENNPVVEAEALRQANLASPTGQRRAGWALALLRTGRAQEAIEVLPEAPERIEEWIALGLIQKELGHESDALESLQSVLPRLEELSGQKEVWLNYLEEGLLAVGDLASVLKANQFRVQKTPVSGSARMGLAEKALAAGNAKAAVDHARLALALAPGSPEAQRILARSLQACGLPGAALSYWQTLAQGDSEAKVDLGKCALEAGELSLAEATAREILQTRADSVRGQIMLAKCHAHRGDLEAAYGLLVRVSEAVPQSSESWIALADMQAASGDIETAIATLKGAIQVVPSSGGLHIVLSRLLKKGGRLTDALTAAQAACQQEPDRAEWLAEYGALLHDLGHDERALPILQRAVMRRPGAWPARYCLASIYESTEQFEQAYLLLSPHPSELPPQEMFVAGRVAVRAAASSGDPEALERGALHLRELERNGFQDPALHLWLGKVQELSGNPEDAIEAFNQCLDRGDSLETEIFLEAIEGMVTAARSTDQVSLALSVLEEASEQRPDSIDLLNLLSQTYLEGGFAEKATESAQLAVSRNPEAEASLGQLGRAAREAQEWAVAIEALERLATKAPEKVDHWLALAEVLFEAQEADRARTALAQALWIERREPASLGRISRLLRASGDPASGKRFLSRALNIEPTNASLLEDLAVTSEECADLETSRRAWEELLELQPENPVALAGAARIHWALNRRSEAIGIWQRALSIHPEDADLHATLGRAYVSNGEPLPGLNHYELAIRLDSTNPSLAVEAGRVAMDGGALELALGWLENSLDQSPDQFETSLALGECLLRLNRPSEAHETLAHAASLGALPVRAQAQMALALVEEGNLGAASTILDALDHTEIKNQHDAIWAARVCLKSGRWQDSVELLKTRMEVDSEDANLALELARVTLRILDAHWLYSDAAGAARRAPKVGADLKGLLDHILDRLESRPPAGAEPSEIELLRLRARAACEAKAGETLEALFELASASQAPQDFDGLLIACLRWGKPKRALDTLAGGAEPGPTPDWGPLLTGLCYSLVGDHAEALDQFRAARGRVQVRPLAEALSADAHLAAARLRLAIKELESALAAWPDEPEWQFRLASAYSGRDQMEAALPHFQQAAELEPENARYLLELARAYHAAGDIDEARAAYARSLRYSPEDADAWREAGKLSLVAEDPESAAECFRQAIALSRDDSESLVGACRASLALGEESKASEYARAASRISPEDPQVLMAYGEVLAQSGQLEKALDVLDQARRRSDQPEAVLLARGKLYLESGQPDEAVSELARALDIQSQDANLWAVQAEALLACRRFDEALEAASRASSLSARAPEYLLLLARICRMQGHLDRALDELTHLARNAPQDGRVAFELGRVYEDRQEGGPALAAYERAIELNPGCGRAHLRAGLLLKDLKEYSRAARMLRHAADLTPGDPHILRQLAAVRALELVHGGMPKTAVSS